LAGSAVLACQSDDRLVSLVRSGHERAFEAIVQRYRGSLVRYCRRLLPESRCEDAVQQALINAHSALLASEDSIQLKPWLFAITRNAALNMLRQNGWNYEQIPSDFDGVRQPDQVFEERTRFEQTVEALTGLPERQRDALVMREFEGRSYDEIALLLGANGGAVRQLLNRARGALRAAASAVIPPPLVLRAAAALPPGDGRRAAEILGGLGAAGVAQPSATALVAGTLVVGVVEAPLSIDSGKKTTRENATLSTGTPQHAKQPSAATQADTTPVALHGSRFAATQRAASGSHSGNQGGGDLGRQLGSSHSGPGRSGSSDDSGSGESGHSGSGGRQQSGSGSTGSGSDDSPSTVVEHSGEHSGTSGGSGTSDGVASVGGSGGVSGRSGSGSGSGSDDGGAMTAVTSPTSGPGSTPGGSGTSGSGTSGSGDSGSGSSGSGSSGSTSGSGDSKDLLEH
jgi:RNA polymerase sigma factor (sigma-70 family)